jgi:hypothetical protein
MNSTLFDSAGVGDGHHVKSKGNIQKRACIKAQQ